MSLINLNFVHPQYGTVFNADVDAALTAAEMLNNLILSGFIQDNPAGYRLALREQFMQAGQPLITLDGLESGSALRIIENKSANEQTNTLYVRHPINAIYAPAQYNAAFTLKQFLDNLREKGFIEKTEGLELYFNAKKVENDQLLSAALPDAAYVELSYAGSIAQEVQLSDINKTLAEIKSSNDSKLQQILDYLPPASAIPIDPERAVNPTQDIYETVDGIISEVFQQSNLLAPQKVSLWNPLPLILGIFSAVSLIVLTVLYSIGVFG